MLKRLLSEATNELKAAGCPTPRLDAEVLLMHACRLTRSQLIASLNDGVSQKEALHYRELIARRKKREPVAYLVGEKEFWSRSFLVNPDVLVPRPETEHLIETMLNHFPATEDEYCFCDIGTGSGCIAITLACEFPHARIIGTDISMAALKVARKNAERHGVLERICFQKADMLTGINDRTPRLDAIIANPPYVSIDEYPGLAPELRFEPRQALTDKDDGLKYLRILLDQAADRLKPGGILVLEAGLAGLPPITPAWLEVKEIRDLASRLRGGVYYPRKSDVTARRAHGISG
jgi:release factor glutamine methyltransferase